MKAIENLRLKVWVVLSVSLVLLLAMPCGVLCAGFETPHNLKASEILPKEIIKGEHYSIRDKVVSHGYMNHFTVDSDFGVFETTGNGALRKLLREIHAIGALRKITESEAFAKSVQKAVMKPVYFGKNLITDPVDTVSGIPRGVSRVFGNIATSVSETQDPSEDARIKQALQVAAYKREYASKLGVDVYSSNKLLQKELNKVGWAGAIGSLSVSAATTAIGGSFVTTVSGMRLAKQINETLKEEPPSRLRIINDEKLSAMSIPQELRKRYLDHPDFTPRHDTIIVTCLAELKRAKGRDAFLEFALLAHDEESADFVQNMAQTMAGYHSEISPIMKIGVIDGIVLAKAENESVLIPFPLDHGVWTERADRVFRNFADRYKAEGLKGKLELWVTGTLSPMAQEQVKGLGIEVEENVDKRIGFMD
jgi:hypothetical protein